MAESVKVSQRTSVVDDVVRGRYLPWFCAALGLAALSIRVGVPQAVVIAVSSCALLALVTWTIRWCVSGDLTEPQDRPSLFGRPVRISGRVLAFLGRPTAVR